MNPEALLTELRNRGIALAVSGVNLVVAAPAGVGVAAFRGEIARHKAALIAMVGDQWWPEAVPRPCLSELVQRHGRIGFEAALHAVTGCDFDERNPTWEEICVLDAHLRRARPMKPEMASREAGS